jgi:hypothetical protein
MTSTKNSGAWESAYFPSFRAQKTNGATGWSTRVAPFSLAALRLLLCVKACYWRKHPQFSPGKHQGRSRFNFITGLQSIPDQWR